MGEVPQLTPEEWMKLWRQATSRDIPDEKTERSLLRFRAGIRSKTQNTYLCLQQDGSVCINGTKQDPNTLFTVIHMYEIGYFQIICSGGPCENNILFVKAEKLESRVYDPEEDNVDDPMNLPDETLFTMEPNANKQQVFMKSKMGPCSLVYPTMGGDQNYKVSLEEETDGPSDDRLLFEVTFARKETAV